MTGALKGAIELAGRRGSNDLHRDRLVSDPTLPR